MARLLVYDAYENKVYTYSSLRENDPMPYSTGRTLTVREFRGKSNSPVLWTTIAAMEAWNLTRRKYGTALDTKTAAPSDESRMTNASTPIADKVNAVSLTLSPFVIELPDLEILTTSAPKYLAANSKELLVLVDASKNNVAIDLPLKTSSFLF